MKRAELKVINLSEDVIVTSCDLKADKKSAKVTVLSTGIFYAALGKEVVNGELANDTIINANNEVKVGISSSDFVNGGYYHFSEEANNANIWVECTKVNEHKVEYNSYS